MIDSAGSLDGSVSVVTGGNGGIGSAICRRLAAAGSAVVVGYRSHERAARELAGELPGSRHAAFRVDVTDGSSTDALAEFIRSEYGSLGVLVNCAGMTRMVPHGDLDALSDEVIDEIFRTNWRGAFAVIRSLADLLRAGAGGVVVNISSIAGTTGIGSNVAYCASKAGLDSLTRSLARALGPAIRVVSVAPGWVVGEYARRADPDYLAAQLAATPLARLATPDEVADAVWCAAAVLTATTGAVLPVDGGRHLGA